MRGEGFLLLSVKISRSLAFQLATAVTEGEAYRLSFHSNEKLVIPLSSVLAFARI